MSLKFSSPIPHSNPSRTSDASSLKRRSEAILPSQLTTPSRIKRARIATNNSIDDHATGDRANSGDAEDFAHIGFAENLLFLDLVEHADHRRLNLFFDLV